MITKTQRAFACIQLTCAAGFIILAVLSAIGRHWTLVFAHAAQAVLQFAVFSLNVKQAAT